jgi:hypothetical protein
MEWPQRLSFFRDISVVRIFATQADFTIGSSVHTMNLNSIRTTLFTRSRAFLNLVSMKKRIEKFM